MKIKYILVVFFLQALSMRAYAADFAVERELYIKSNIDYAHGDYGQAISGYNEILDRGLESGALYYNLGNAYFKNNDLGRAIANYLRALRLMPRDPDLISNIEYARSLVRNNIRTRHLNPFMSLALRLSTRLTLDAATYIVISLYYLSALAALVIIIKGRGRGYLIYLELLASVLLAVFCIVFYFTLKENYLDKRAVVVQEELEARFEPFDTATVHFLLDAGQEVAPIGCGNEWVRIKRPDGRQGWVKAAGIEKV